MSLAATDAPSGAAAGGAERANPLIILAVMLTAIMEVLDMTIVNVALPHIKAAFGLTSDQTVWIVTSYIVASVGVMPLTGLFARRFGRRRLISTAIIGFAVFSMLGGLSWSLGSIVAFRIGQGLFGAFLIPLAQSILFDSFPREKRGQAMAMFGLGVIMAPVFGPTAGALLTEHFSWRAVFYVNLPVAAFALLLITGELARQEVRKVPVDWGGLVLMVTAIGALQMTLDLGQDKGWFSSHFIQLTALTSAGAFLAFVVRGIGRADNIVDFGLLSDRSFAAANVTIMGFGLAMYGAIAILPLFVQGLLGYPVIQSGELFIPRGIAAGFSSVLTGAVLMRRFDPRLIVGIGLTFTGAGNVMLSQLTAEADFWQLAWPGVVTGLGMGMFFVPMSTLAFQNVSSDKQDEASGIYGVTRSIGSSIGIAIIGWQIARRIQIHTADLVTHITPYSAAARAYLSPLHLTPTNPAGAEVLAGEVAKQAAVMAYQDAFLIAGIAAFAMLPALFVLQRPDPADGGAAMAH